MEDVDKVLSFVQLVMSLHESVFSILLVEQALLTEIFANLGTLLNDVKCVRTDVKMTKTSSGKHCDFPQTTCTVSFRKKTIFYAYPQFIYPLIICAWINCTLYITIIYRRRIYCPLNFYYTFIYMHFIYVLQICFQRSLKIIESSFDI